MDISTHFPHEQVEDKWYRHWEQKGYFRSVPDERPPYSIVLPPPNVTGVLHMGHALNDTVQDILIRRAKMKGFNTLWIPGTDHASIATEAKVVAMLKEKGIDKDSLSREEFLRYAWEWKEKYGGIILDQLRKLGCSMDWERTHFTLDTEYSEAVIHVFVDLYRKNRIYRDVKMIHWDPQAQTAVSDEEVVFRETQSSLCYLRYPIEGSDESITIATVRPETILADTAVCVHPEDPRYRHLIGKRARIPLTDRWVPIIADTYIDREFGTGALKVTPAHDPNDHELGKKHGLDVIDMLGADGRLNQHGGAYSGLDRFEARKKIIEDLRLSPYWEKEEAYVHQVGYSERTQSVIEPRLSMQWWCRMEEMARPALDYVLNGDIEFFPPKFKNLYRHWMENIRDWCISRQLWWGHRIPAWYDSEGDLYVAASEEEAYEQFRQKKPQLSSSTSLTQDEDVLDTWFSSWLWPLQVLGWHQNPDNEDLNYYYPTQALVTAPEIIFFWVARMIMAGAEYRGEVPFRHVYFTGIVRDLQRRKMSKSLGNSPDLLQLIGEHGADAVRFSVMISSPAGNDLLYDLKGLKQGKHFIHKIWNALRLIKIWASSQDSGEGVGPQEPSTPASPQWASQWMKARIQQVNQEVEGYFAEYRLSEALKTIYSLAWTDFCSHYLEWIKPGADQAMDPALYEETLDHFTEILALLHPFMPFFTEEVYHLLRERKDGEDLMVYPVSAPSQADALILEQGDHLIALITAVRDFRNRHQIKPRQALRLSIETPAPRFYEEKSAWIQRLLFLDSLEWNQSPPEGISPMVVNRDKLYIHSPEGLPEAKGNQDELEKELAHLQRFLSSVEKKLGNPRFVENAAAAVVEREKKKQADTLARIQTIKESLNKIAKT